MSTTADELHSVLGGGSFIAKFATVTATYPLVRVSTDAAGITADVRPALVKRLLMPLLPSPVERSEPIWSYSWEELTVIEVGPRSVVFKGPQREFRFIVIRRRALEGLLEAIRPHAIRTTRRATTLGWYLRRRR